MTTDKTIKSKYQPKQTNVTWIDLSGETPIEKHFINGGWVATSSGGSGGTTDYSSLKNKPSIDGVELNGDKSFSDLTDGKLYGGIINTQSTVQPDTSCYYIAEEGGTYQAFGVTVNANERVQIIVHDGTSWEVVSLNTYNYGYAHGKFDKLDDIDSLLTNVVPSSASSSNKLLTERERHFKGWFNSIAELKAAHTATEGDSAYVKDASPATTWSIYVYDSTATTDNNWADSGTDADTSNIQTFASSQEVNEVHIVDNLTTGGSNDVLSAEQGKTLAEGIWEKRVVSKNILDPTKIISGKGVKRTDGTLFTSSSYSCTDFIKVTDGFFAVNYAAKTSGSYVCGACLYNEVDGEKVFQEYTSPLNNGSWVLDRNYVKNYDYIRINFTGTPAEGETYAVYRTHYMPHEFEAYKEEAVRISPQLPITINELNFTTKVYGKNRCNPNTITDLTATGANIQYVNSKNGNISNGVVTFMVGFTDFIEVQGQSLCCNNKLLSSSSPGWAAYDKDYNFTHGGVGGTNYTYQERDVYVRFNLISLDNVQVEIGSTPTEYEAYQEPKLIISNSVLPSSTLTEEDYEDIYTYLSNKKILPNTNDILLPNKYYAVVGDTLQLFIKGMIKAVDPLNKAVHIGCSKGSRFRRYLELTPVSGDVGTHSMTVSVYDDNNILLSQASSNIKIVNAPTSPSTQKNILCIGSSTTANGQWICECQRRLLASDGTPQGDGLSNIAFVGSMTKTVYGQTASFIGKSGWGWYDYATEGRAGSAFRFYLSGTDHVLSVGSVYSNNNHSYTVVEIQTIEDVETILCSTDSSSNTPETSGTLTLTSGEGDVSLTFTSVEQDSANPFWDSVNEKLDFTSYVNTYCNGSIDMVYIMLGLNGSQTPAQKKEYARTFITALHEEYPNCKVILVAGGYPSMVNMMPTTKSNVYGVICNLFEIFKTYKELEEEYSSYVEMESWSAQFDADYNFPLSMKNVNTRNSSVQEPYDINGVHPGSGSPTNAAGYMQYADAAYRSIVAHLCQ